MVILLTMIMLCYAMLLCYYNHPSQLIKQARAQALSASSADLVEEDQEVFFFIKKGHFFISNSQLKVTGEESHLPCQLEIQSPNLVAFQVRLIFCPLFRWHLVIFGGIC